MSTIEAAKLLVSGGATFVQLAVRGRLTPSMAWMGMRGAGPYLAAIAAGDLAEPAVAAERLTTCRGCGAWTRDDRDPEAGWCGPPFEAADLPGGPTCGCLLEAKASVASSKCPRGSWRR